MDSCKTRTPWRGSRFPAQTLTRLCSSTATMTIICAVTRMGPRITTLHLRRLCLPHGQQRKSFSQSDFYGHTFTDEDYTGGFEDLHKYRVFEFGQENPYIYVSLADEKLAYQIFSVWVCDANDDTDCIQADPDDAAFQQILDKAVAGCAFDYGVDVTTDDHILTLSTCTADPNSRLLVVAKLIDGGGADVKS